MNRVQVEYVSKSRGRMKGKYIQKYDAAQPYVGKILIKREGHQAIAINNLALTKSINTIVVSFC